MAVTARGAYRELLKAQRQLFAVDVTARTSARSETRSAFVANAGVAPDLVQEKVQDALEAAGFIRENVAQAVRNERGNYELELGERHIHEGDTPPPLPCDSLNINRANRREGDSLST